MILTTSSPRGWSCRPYQSKRADVSRQAALHDFRGILSTRAMTTLPGTIRPTLRHLWTTEPLVPVGLKREPSNLPLLSNLVKKSCQNKTAPPMPTIYKRLLPERAKRASSHLENHLWSLCDMTLAMVFAWTSKLEIPESPWERGSSCWDPFCTGSTCRPFVRVKHPHPSMDSLVFLLDSPLCL